LSKNRIIKRFVTYFFSNIPNIRIHFNQDMSEKSSTRLSKAAAEFNVSIQTIVEVLGKKGHKIDGGPNTKIPPELFDILVKEFDSDIKVKREAQKIELEFNKREAPAVVPKKETITEEEQEPDLPELMIKNTQIAYAEASKQKKTVQMVTAETNVESPIQEKQIEQEPEKPVVQVAVEQPAPVKKSETEQVDTEPLKESPAQAPKIIVEAPKTEPDVKEHTDKQPVVATPEPPGLVILGKIDLDQMQGRHQQHGGRHQSEKKPHKQAPKEEKPIIASVETKITEEAPKIIEPVEKIEKPEPPVKVQVVEEIPKPSQEPAKSIPEPEVKPIVTEIQVPLVKEESETISSEAIPEEEKLPDNFLKTTFRKLEGPTILGSIQLPETKKATIEKRKPVASSSDERLKAKKKKRKRIKQGEEGAGGTPQQGQPGQKPSQTGGQNRPGQPSQQNRPGQPGTAARAPQPGAQPAKPGEAREKIKPKLVKDRIHEKRGRKDVPKVELTEEEIEKQIKETLARLTTGGKSKASKHRRQKRDAVSEKMAVEQHKLEESRMVLKVTEFVTANELANMMEVHVNEVISTCMSLGLFVSINQRLDAETINVVADEFGFKTEFVSADVQEAMSDLESVDNPDDLQPRHPIVAVMGHVDHGKTKLLDYIRSSNVVAGEAGGITQHIGAYEVQVDADRKITFLDTPGHEAFTAMRARGAKVTDIAIIVIAADDNVMPQTREAINHAQAAGVQMIFAINKIDKANAQPEKVKEELAQMNILVEDWGGKYQSQEISAKSGLNIDILLEKILLEAELLDLKANPDKPAVGTIIESSLDKGRGYLATVLVQSGSLKVGDLVLAGTTLGKVKAMYNERNQSLKVAGPSTPVLLLGLNGAPQAGDKFNVMSDEREAKNIASKRLQLQREQGLRTQKHITLDEIGRRIAIGDFKELNLIVKGDVDGSVEALSDSLLKLSNEEVQVNVIHKSVGQVTETDVMLASASNAVIIGFQVRPSVSARRLAEQEQIDIRIYSIIYTAIEEIKDAILGMLAPKMEEKILCNLEIREVFKITKVGNIAGCMVLDGTITRNTRVRIIRDGIVIHSGQLGSLKRFKDDSKDAKIGQECGLNIENFNDIAVGDIIEGFEQVEVKRTLK